jgi:hypothetical protein
MDGRETSSAGVGVPGIAVDGLDRADLHDLARYITASSLM